jgi:hypothetical protein
MLVDLSNEGFDIVFQRWREEYEGESIDSHKNDFCTTNSGCEELNEEDFQEGEYATEEMGSFEELWPEKCLHIVDTYSKQQQEGEGEEEGEEGKDR